MFQLHILKSVVITECDLNISRCCLWPFAWKVSPSFIEYKDYTNGSLILWEAFLTREQLEYALLCHSMYVNLQNLGWSQKQINE